MVTYGYIPFLFTIEPNFVKALSTTVTSVVFFVAVLMFVKSMGWSRLEARLSAGQPTGVYQSTSPLWKASLEDGNLSRLWDTAWEMCHRMSPKRSWKVETCSNQGLFPLFTDPCLALAQASELGGSPTTSAHIDPYQSISCAANHQKESFRLKLCARHEWKHPSNFQLQVVESKSIAGSYAIIPLAMRKGQSLRPHSPKP